MAIEGAALRSLGSSLSPQSVANTMATFQQIRLREEQQKRFNQSIQNYDAMVNGGSDPQTTAIWKSAQKMNPQFMNDERSFNTHLADTVPAVESFKQLQAFAPQLGIDEEDMKYYLGRVKSNPRGAPAFIARVLDEKRALLAETQAANREELVLQEALARYDRNPESAAQIAIGLPSSMRKEFADSVQMLKDFGGGVGDPDANAIAGIQSAINSFITPDMSNEDIMEKLREEFPDDFDNFEKRGLFNRALTGLRESQEGAAREAGEEIAATQDILGDLTIDGKPVFLAEADGRFQIQLPALEPRKSGIFGLFQDATALQTPSVSEENGGLRQSYQLLDIVTRPGGSVSFVRPGKKTSLQNPKTVIAADLGANGKNIYGRATSVDEGEDLMRSVTEDMSALINGIEKTINSNIAPEQEDQLRAIIDDLNKKMMSRIRTRERKNVKEGTTSTITEMKPLSRTNYANEVAQEIVDLLKLQARYGAIIESVRPR